MLCIEVWGVLLDRKTYLRSDDLGPDISKYRKVWRQVYKNASLCFIYKQNLNSDKSLKVYEEILVVVFLEPSLGVLAITAEIIFSCSTTYTQLTAKGISSM